MYINVKAYLCTCKCVHFVLMYFKLIDKKISDTFAVLFSASLVFKV